MFSSIGLALAALLGAPLFTVIAAGALLGFHRADIDISVLALEINRLVDNPVLISIPLFTFAGYLMSESATSKRLVALSQALFGWLPGGLAIVSVMVCGVFTALTGASGVTIIALGALLYPALIEQGYPERFSLGLVTTSGSLGLLFPPAIPLILYGIIAEVSIDDLFTAGLLPGLIMLLLLAIYSSRQGRISAIATEPFAFAKVRAALRGALWELPLPVIVLGGIYSGVFAISEAAAVTAVHALVAEVLIYREVALRDLAAIMCRSMTLVGGILVILGVSMASTNYLIDQEVPMKLFQLVSAHITSKWTFLLILNGFLLLLGCILDIFSAIVLVVPLVLPLARGYQIDPIHLGIIFLANMQIGYNTPPIGMNLFIAGYRFKQPVVTLYRATLPFLAILMVTVLIITYWPDLSLFLVRLRG
ncbi:MAG: C4-dicarboxylate ABC transporter [Syntrophobacteraceae bacterium CG2_30_61_12]|nr:MAG: C4-dicarboxylate ABC transporter [Syntrophobacteraceae bacterium CG2_30_61_12]